MFLVSWNIGAVGLLLMFVVMLGVAVWGMRKMFTK